MFINNKNLSLPINDLSSVYVVADFDKTITKGTCESSWAVFSHSELLPKSFIEDRKKFYEYYRPIELDESFDKSQKEILMEEWQTNVFNLFKKYKLSEENFNKIINTTKILEFRKGAVEFIKFLSKNNIPLIIMSAGVGNVIEAFLKNNNCLFDNIYISSNTVGFKNGYVDKLENKLIHCLNKNEISLPNNISEKIKNRTNAILIGDQTADINMVSKKSGKNITSIGFYISEDITSLNVLNSTFDVVFDESEGYDDILKLLFNK